MISTQRKLARIDEVNDDDDEEGARADSGFAARPGGEIAR